MTKYIIIISIILSFIVGSIGGYYTYEYFTDEKVTSKCIPCDKLEKLKND